MIEQTLDMAALIKLASGEPVSETDFQRIIQILSTPIQVSTANAENAQALYTKLRTVLRDVYFNEGR